METVLKINTYGSLCSGIEAATYVFKPMGVKPLWYSEIAEFPSRFLSIRYPETPNVGDMTFIPQMIEEGDIEAPDMICGGTPCQAFSFAGWKNGLNDDRGQLTLKFIDIIDKSDSVRAKKGLSQTIFMWENVEGVLSDKTNAFGCFLAGLAGCTEPLPARKWSTGGVILGQKRNIAWRILDSKYFGVPQQRKRIYVIGGGKDFHPERILFETGDIIDDIYKPKYASLFEPETTTDVLTKTINNNKFEVFRVYSDCVYTAYGTKWNGNAAAFNGSLFVAQNDRVRRLTPLECERLMGFSDNYTDIPNCSLTQRYQAVGNSWAIPVIKWIFERILKYNELPSIPLPSKVGFPFQDIHVYQLADFTPTDNVDFINASTRPNNCIKSNMLSIVDEKPEEKLYLSPTAAKGILRRKQTLNARINERLEVLLSMCANKG